MSQHRHENLKLFFKTGGKLSRSTSISQLLCLEKFILTCNGVEHVIEVPEKVSSKVYQPSVPADNGVNEMRYQVARLYTALNIEVNFLFYRPF